MRFKLVEDVDKLGVLDKLDSLFGQSDVYMWSTYILPNGHFLNPDNYYTSSDELDYEHSDFINFVKNTFGVSCWDAEDLFDEYCIKMNVTYPYLALPKNKPTIKQFQSIKDVISNKESFIYSVADIEDRVGDLGNAKEPLMILTPFDETAFDLSIYSADDVVKEINKAYMTKSFLNESKVRKDLIDLTNRKFGDLTVIEYDKEKSRATGETYWKCKCSCGKETSVARKHLLNGDIKSCGHTKRQNGLDHYEDNFKGMRDRQNKYHTNLEIIRNQKMQPNNTSGVKGVDYHKGRDMWRARVRVNGKELTKWSKDKDVAIKWRQDAIDKYYKPQIDKAIKAGDLKENITKSFPNSVIEEPLYHGARHNKYDLDMRYASNSNPIKGLYFTSSDKYAGGYGETKKYYINITNPLDITGEYFTGAIYWLLKKNNIDIDKDLLKKLTQDITDRSIHTFEYIILRLLGKSTLIADGNFITQLIKRAGYDGIITNTDTNSEERTYVVFSKKQVKSVE